ncbi:exported protein of unknown function (plasmid) [Cupriavidus taiwanensis]|uniref:Uncharacterized protein n=1 Tax=Cupriavidus taiwanensis TaxID=164546 RepID=A0A375I5E0_9BURK|nr:exported hypothetical protein [Cupriavidus taiwanensis]SPK74818.1 exported protein of unknown function [Cupriavidus taiwanensis]
MRLRSVQVLATLTLLGTCFSTNDGSQPGKAAAGERPGLPVGATRPCQAEADALLGAAPLSVVRAVFDSCPAQNQGSEPRK